MTNLEFQQIMRGAGYEESVGGIWHWKAFAHSEFTVMEISKRDQLSVSLEIIARDSDVVLHCWQYTFENVSKMNSIEFTKKLEGMTDYAYSLYKDINRHIDALSIKMETKAKRLGM